jgi:dephospho-CoA kinase
MYIYANNNMVIGITGGIGSGKTTVTEYLRGEGFSIIDADEISRESVAPGNPALAALADAFGDEILNPDGSLDRKKLAALTFASESATARLNEITHGDIIGRIKTRLNAHGEKGRPVFISAPLLYESGLDKLCREVWVITADEQTRVKRAAARDALPEKEIKARAARQMSEEKKIIKADRTIDNNGDIESLKKEISIALAAVAAKA